VATIEKRIGTNGDIRYRVRVRLRGEQPRARTLKRKTDAELWAKKVESDLGHSFYVPTTADRRRTLGELIDKVLKCGRQDLRSRHATVPSDLAAHGFHQHRDFSCACRGFLEIHASCGL
jgi:hypothetical protein